MDEILFDLVGRNQTAAISHGHKSLNRNEVGQQRALIRALVGIRPYFHIQCYMRG